VGDTTTSGATALKSRLLDLLRRGRAELDAWLGDLSAAERAAIGVADAWAPKDTLAHIAFWQGASAHRLEAIRRGDEPQTYEDFQRYNDETFERERLRPWEEVVAMARRTVEAHLAAAGELSEDELTDPARHPWLEGRPLWTSVAGNGFEHPMEHFCHFYRERGDLTRAERVMERQMEGMLGLDDSHRSRGAAYYNQACFWALAGQPERAIPLMRDALALRPDLVAWSRQDTDLVSLRDLPEFQAMYTSLGAE
jgi:hypothetical protein